MRADVYELAVMRRVSGQGEQGNPGGLDLATPRPLSFARNTIHLRHLDPQPPFSPSLQ